MRALRKSRQSRLYITTMLASPSLTPGGMAGSGGMSPSKKERTRETAKRSPNRAIRLVFWCMVPLLSPGRYASARW